VPAGAVFGPAELVFGIYEKADYERLKVVIDALQLVEDDYLGGAGSRGSGKVQFKNIKVYARSRKDYAQDIPFQNFADLQGLIAAYPKLQTWLVEAIPVE
jgi:CRISPR-associated protein Csm3